MGMKALDLAIASMCLSAAIAIIGSIQIPLLNQSYGAGAQATDINSMDLNDTVENLFRASPTTVSEDQQTLQEYAVSFLGGLGVAGSVMANIATGNFLVFIVWGMPAALAALLASPLVFINAMFAVQLIWRMRME